MQAAHEASWLLEGSLEIASRGLAIDVDLGKVRLEGGLEGNDALDDERVGVLEVQMHYRHHTNAHELGAHEALELADIVGMDRRRHELGLLGGAHGGRLDIFQGSEIYEGMGQRVMGYLRENPGVGLPFFLSMAALM